MKIRRTVCMFLILVSWVSAQSETNRWLVLGDSITQAGHYVDYIEAWLLLNEAEVPEIIDLGLSSETVSGLNEPGLQFDRPYLHDRLEAVLARVEPDVVMACYGMNCAIYHPFSKERFAKYQEGIKQLAEACRQAGAKLILVTPPPYAGRVLPKDPPDEGDPYTYRNPSPDYNEVLSQYGDWIMSLDGIADIRSIDIRPGIEKFMENSYENGDPVHPNNYGHDLIGESILRGLGKDTGSDLLETGINPWKKDPRWLTIINLVRLQRETYDRPLMNDIGHNNNNVMKRFQVSLDEGEAEYRALDSNIDEVLTTGTPE